MGQSAGEQVLPVLMGLAMLVGWIAWLRWVHRRMRPRTVVTALPPGAVRRVFLDTVATWSWNVQEDHGGRVVARSSLLTGIARQRIGLTVRSTTGGRTVATVEVVSYEGQWLRSPQSPYTLLWRIDEFLRSVHAADPTAREIDD